MKKTRILFSPIGDTDPVRDYYDGAMIHIVRHYKPDKVYLYLSKDMMKNEIANNIYSRAIKYIDNNIEIKIYPAKEEKLINEVHKFDVFYNPFFNIVEDIKKENDNYEILLNISSGTPAMKSATVLLDVALEDINIKSIQVATPNRKSNRDMQHIDVKQNDIELLLENCFDSIETNDEGTRCSEESLIETKKIVIYNNLKKMLERNDFSGIDNLIEQNKNIISEEVYYLVKHIYNRYIGNEKKARTYAKNIKGIDLFPIKNADTYRIVEKFNIVKIKSERGEIQDWLFLIYNIIEKIYEMILYSNNVDLEKCYDNFKVKDKDRNEYKNIKKFNIELFKKHYLEIYNNVLISKLEKETKIYLDFNKIVDIVTYILDDKEKTIFIEENNYLQKLKSLRNDVAHELSFVEEKDIEEKTSLTVKKLEKILEKNIKQYAKDTNINNLISGINIYKEIKNKILIEFEKEI